MVTGRPLGAILNHPLEYTLRDEGEFGRLLHQLRRERDLTQENLGQAAFCSRDTIKKLESGQRRPSRQLAAQLADVLGLENPTRAAFLAAARASRATDLARAHIATA